MKFLGIALILVVAVSGCSTTRVASTPASQPPVSSAPAVSPVPQVSLPNVVGQPLGAGTAALQALGLSVTSSATDGSAPDPSWTVVAQSPSPEVEVNLNSTVSLSVNAPPPTVTYTVTGNGRASSITYSTGGTGQVQNTDVILPWSASVPKGSGPLAIFIILAQDGTGTSITCTISDRSGVLATNTSTGKYAIAQCQSK